MGLRLAKGIAICSMVWVHSLVWVLPREEYESNLAQFPYSFFGPSLAVGFLALCLPPLALVKSVPRDRILFFSVILVWLGYVLNTLLFGIEKIGHWDVLQFIGVASLIVVSTERILRRKYFFSVALVLVAITPFIRDAWKGENYWHMIVVGRSYTYWPVLPWVAFCFLGRFFAEEKLGPFSSWLTAKAAWGYSAVVLLFLALPESREFLGQLRVWGSNIYQPPVTVLLAIFSGYLLFINICHQRWFFRPRQWNRVFYDLGDSALFVYLLHLFVGIPLSHLVTARFGVERFLVFPLFMIGLAGAAARGFAWAQNRSLRLSLRGGERRC